MSSNNNEKGAEARRANDEYFAFLDRRIPELHAEGKPKSKLGDKASLADRIREAQTNAAAATHPGRTAREVADAEWADRAD